MFRVAERAADDDRTQDVAPVSTMAASAPVQKLTSVAASESRYGARRAPNLPVIGLILLLHVALLFAMMQARHHYLRHKAEKLTVVNLMPPPPPPAAETPPPPSKPVVVAPRPIVQTPVPPVQTVQTTPDPTPAPPAPPAPAPPAVTVSAPSTISGGDLSTQMVAGKPPRYPIDSRRKREQGTVVLSLTLGFDGAVESIAVTHSSGFSRLDDAAKDAVKRWRWRPTVQNGQPVRLKGVVEIPFVIAA